MRKVLAVQVFRRSGFAGVALVVATLAAALAAASGFLDPFALLITVGGALGVTAVTFSRERIAAAWQELARALLGEEADPREVIGTMKRLARIHRVEGALALERAAEDTSDPFLRAAIALTVECRDSQELGEALAGEIRAQAAEGEAARSVVVTLGKLFPAFGLIGTLIGLVLLLRNLSSGDFASIGPGLGIAVLTTLYGALLSNVVVLPLATKLQAHLARRLLRLQMIREGALLVFRKEYPTRIERVLRGYAGIPATEEAGEKPILLTERAA
jgi:chemotaxis protein MotA